jgi:hypothetical protein
VFLLRVLSIDEMALNFFTSKPFFTKAIRIPGSNLVPVMSTNFLGPLIELFSIIFVVFGGVIAQPVMDSVNTFKNKWLARYVLVTTIS